MALGWLKRPFFTHPATWTFAGCWLVAAAWLLAAGRGLDVARGAGLAVGVLFFCALTIRFTDEPAEPATPGARERVYLCVQLFLLGAVGLILCWTGLHLQGAVAATPHIPLWTDAVQWFGRLGERYLDSAWVGSPYHALANPARYFLLPLLFLVPLTGFRHLGLGPGHRVVRVTALWCALPLVAVAYSLLTGGLTIAGWGKTLVHNTLVNGPFEEFLFRGATQTRLTVLLGPAWGVALSSLAFGVWHLASGYADTGGQSLADGLARTVLNQAMMGLGFGVIFHRTRNLIASSVFHVVLNSLA